MSFLELLKIEFMKVKRSKIVPLIFIAPLLVVASGVASLSRYFTPEYTNAWPAMFIQSALVYAYYLLPFSMIVVCVMIAGRETGNNGILKCWRCRSADMRFRLPSSVCWHFTCSWKWWCFSWYS